MILKCSDCNFTIGCIDLLRWGNNPHFCQLCNERELCEKLRNVKSYDVNTDYKCPTIACIDAARSYGHTK